MEQTSKTIKGKVEHVFCSKEGGDPYAFRIRGEDNKTYFAHLGDLKPNEEILYGNNGNKPTEFLKKDDEVEFQCFTPQTDLLAIHVNKKQTN